jgi:hypothetical protein
MESKGKKMASVKRKAQSSALRVQVHVKLPKLPGVEYTAKFLDEIVEQWFDTGKTPARIKIKAISWTRGGRPGGKETAPGRIETARESFQRIKALRFRTVL